MHFSLKLTAVVCLVSSVACSKGGGNPTTPTSSEPTLSAPTTSPTVRIVGGRVSGLEHVVELAWNAIPQTTSYVVELRGSGQLLDSVEVTESRYELSRPEITGVGVRAKNNLGVGPAPTPTTVGVVNMRDVVEALFFNTGPYGDTEVGNVEARQLYGWSGGTVTVSVEDTVPSEQYATASRIAEQFTQAAGIYSMRVISTPGLEPRLQVGSIRIVYPPANQLLALCPPFASGRVAPACNRLGVDSRGRITSSLVTLSGNISGIAAHELGHAFGLFHVLTRIPLNSTAGITAPVMGSRSATEFSTMELEAIRAVYSNGFRHGTPKRDLIARGLINSR